MSYDYLVCRASPGSSSELAFDECEPIDPIGDLEQIKDAISRVFPSVSWSPHATPAGVAWFGLGGPPEFQITYQDGMPITNFMMSHASPEEVRLILRTMGLVAMDLQQEVVIVG
jgi:hypothetical protein